MTLKRSERNSIIEDFRNGIINPDYEVKPTKTKGRYTVRKRKTPLTDEQLAELEAVHENEEVDEYGEPVEPPKPVKTTTRTRKTSQGSSESSQIQIPSKDKVLYTELQNQLNSQMLFQINELTNKVSKLKAWKKKVKSEMYEEIPEQEIIQREAQQQQQPEKQQQHEAQQEALARETFGQGPQDHEVVEPEQREAQPQQIQPEYEYMNKIPQQAYEQTYQPTYEQTYQPTYERRNHSSTRNSIDYSKFGF